MGSFAFAAAKAVIGLLFLLGLTTAYAEVVEETGRLALEINDAKGVLVKRPAELTVFRDASRASSPFIVLSHGRLVPQEGRAKMSAARFREVARYLVQQGFAVFILTRIGYGENADVDVEDTGMDCDHRDHRATFAPGVAQVTALLEHVGRQPYVDRSRGLIIGTSFGGMITLSVAAMNPPGIVGAVNFSGGSGADSSRTGDPCNGRLLNENYREEGSAAKIPTLWLYSANDNYWGPTLPLAWQKLYVDSGGKARFVQLPAYSKDPHLVFTADPKAWQPAFESFAETLGLKPAR
jgi:dienelactone hydrolase